MPLDPADSTNFLLFRKRFEKLLSHSIFDRGGLGFTITVGPEGTGGKFASAEDLESFAARLRHFYLEGSPIAYQRVRGSAGRYCPGKGSRLLLRYLRERWNIALRQGSFGWTTRNDVTGEQTNCTPEWALQRYFYGDLFHVDNPELVEEFAGIETDERQWAFFRGRLQDTFSNMVHALGDLEQLVGYLRLHETEPEEFFIMRRDDHRCVRVECRSGFRAQVEAPPEGAICVTARVVEEPTS